MILVPGSDPLFHLPTSCCRSSKACRWLIWVTKFSYMEGYTSPSLGWLWCDLSSISPTSSLHQVKARLHQRPNPFLPPTSSLACFPASQISAEGHTKATPQITASGSMCQEPKTLTHIENLSRCSNLLPLQKYLLEKYTGSRSEVEVGPDHAASLRYMQAGRQKFSLLHTTPQAPGFSQLHKPFQANTSKPGLSLWDSWSWAGESRFLEKKNVSNRQRLQSRDGAPWASSFRVLHTYLGNPYWPKSWRSGRMDRNQIWFSRDEPSIHFHPNFLSPWHPYGLVRTNQGHHQSLTPSSHLTICTSHSIEHYAKLTFNNGLLML